MSEKLLKAIMRLLVIVAKEEGVIDETEITALREFLQENVSSEDTNHYLGVLEVYLKEVSTTRANEHTHIKEITTSINNELTERQKVVVMVRLMELIVADGKITTREDTLVHMIGKYFNLDEEVVKAIIHFVVNHDPNGYQEDYSVVVSGTKMTQNTRHLYLENLDGHLIFFKLPKTDACFFKFSGADVINRKGLEVAPNKIKVFSAGSSVKGKSTERLYYSDVIGVLREKTADEQVSFVAENITYRFPNGNAGLVNVNIAESSGKLFAIMGGSGAGKSTLVDVLNGVSKPYKGTVRINGLDIYNDSKMIEGVIGNVPQDDLLIEDLTVYQNLLFSAKLCFDQLSQDELHLLVSRTLESLGLLAASDLTVGNPLQKTISGGQRKRLNIGLELLREPAVLFVDEPTSGLSSRDSENIMDLLKELSLQGKMVFVVIHQPSSEIFKMFDRLLILDVGGRQIYYGDPIKAVSYFKGIVEMVGRDQSACVVCGNVNPEQIFNIIEMKVVDEYGRFTNKRKFTPQQWREYYQQKVREVQAIEATSRPKRSLNLPGRLKQAKIFFQRDLLAKISNRQYVIINLLEAPVLALLLALITKYAPAGMDYSFYKNENIPVFFFMSIIVALFMGLTVSAEEIIKDRKMLKRESFLHLSRLSYLSSKMVLLFGLSAIQTLLFVVVGSWILDIQGMTYWHWMVLFSVSCFANVLGLNISAGFNSVITVYILIPLLIIPQLILSGVVVNFDRLNPAFANQEKVPIIGELMASRWAYEALVVTQFRDNAYTSHRYQLEREIANNTYFSMYYATFLEELLENCYRNEFLKANDPSLNLLQNELAKQLTMHTKITLPEMSQLQSGKINSRVYGEIKDFIYHIKLAAQTRKRRARDELDKLIAEKTATPALKDSYLSLRNEHVNERLSLLLKNVQVKERIVRSDDELVQKIYPVYARNEFPDHILDFRTTFYHPEKYLLGRYLDTKFFNVIVIWIMTFALFLCLYFDWIRKLVQSR